MLALVNPVVCAAMFLQAEATRARTAQLRDVFKAVLTVLVILALAALVGAKILHAFGVSLDAFSVAGGGVLAWIGVTMLIGGSGSGASSGGSQDGAPRGQASPTPLILFAASPGTITGVITLAVAHSRLELPVTALIAVVVATAVLGLTLLAAVYLGNHERHAETGGIGGIGFVRDTATRFMGLIVIAMGVQFALTGFRAFMAAAPG